MTSEEHQIWQEWANYLDRWGVREMTAWLLEAAEPVTLLGAQMVYMGQPFLKPFVSSQHVNALANLLEEPDKSKAFVVFLREANN